MDQVIPVLVGEVRERGQVLVGFHQHLPDLGELAAEHVGEAD
ncbi:hypothetical protein ACIQUX_27190 [Streptomyces sp. NPDC101133]